MVHNDERDWFFMGLALEQAQQALMHDEVPIGAVLVGPEGVCAQGFNQPCSTCDPTAHAEIIALRQACARTQNYRLNKEYTLYVTLQPCMMCSGALMQARIGRIVYAASDSRPQSIHRHLNVFASEAFNHQIIVQGGVREEEARQILNTFFETRR